MRKEEFFKLIRVRPEKQVSQSEKSEKLTFEISILVNNNKLKKKLAHAIGGKFLHG